MVATAQRRRVKSNDEDIDHAHRISIADVIIEALGKQGDLASVFTLNKPLNRFPSR